MALGEIAKRMAALLRDEQCSRGFICAIPRSRRRKRYGEDISCSRRETGYDAGKDREQNREPTEHMVPVNQFTGVFTRTKNFLIDVRSEMRKVVTPSRKRSTHHNDGGDCDRIRLRGVLLPGGCGFRPVDSDIAALAGRYAISA